VADSVPCTLDEIASLTAADVEARRKDRAGQTLEAMFDIALDPAIDAAVRVSAGRVAMGKVMPDRKVVEHSGDLKAAMTVTLLPQDAAI
jgi:hypothetical protein